MRRVLVNRKGADRIASGHPWIFASDVTDRGDAEPGDTVFVFDPRDKPVGTFHYSSTSQITLRQLSPRLEETGYEFFRNRILRALEHRARVVEGTEASRLIYGEADGLPALIVDRYGRQLVLQALSQGMDRACATVVRILQELLSPDAIVARNDVAVRRLEGLPAETTVLSGAVAGTELVTLNGLRWHVDLLHGQKTGIYLDQRENYLAAARWARGNVLDCFTSTGGFALHLARVCPEVEGVDSGEAVLASARRNADTNAITNVRWQEADVFNVLPAYAQAGKRFGTVVLDPPAFAKSKSAIEGAARGYRDINYRALRLLEPGGILVSCSCSFHFSEAMLLETVAAAALDAGRRLRVLERRMQALDHPVLLTVPETLYLKCLIFEVI